MRVHLPANGEARSVRITNNGSGQPLLQVKAVPWFENVDTAPRAAEILAMPPVFKLAPEGEQVLRLATRGPLDNAAERAYRLVITQVPEDTGPAEGLTFTMRFDLPLFVTPAGAEPDPAWHLEQDGSEPRLVLHNQGKAHLRVEHLMLASGPRAALEISDIKYALAGESVSWPLGVPLESLPPTLEVRAETNHGPITATVARPTP